MKDQEGSGLSYGKVPILPSLKAYIMAMNMFRFNLSDWWLLVTNLGVIGVAVWQGWDLATLVWIYWLQSIVIGGFNFVKLLSLERFSTKNFRINNRLVDPTRFVKYYTAFFFLFHY